MAIPFDWIEHSLWQRTEYTRGLALAHLPWPPSSLLFHAGSSPARQTAVCTVHRPASDSLRIRRIASLGLTARVALFNGVVDYQRAVPIFNRMVELEASGLDAVFHA